MATDSSPDAALAAQSAIELCEETGSELHGVRVGEYLPTFYAYTEQEPAELQRHAQRLLDEETRRIRAADGRIAGAHLRLGRPDDEQIVNLSEDLGVGVIVIGSRGLGRLRRSLMGSVSDSVVRHAHCPVFVVRGDEERHV